jgi:hypothetical protein
MVFIFNLKLTFPQLSLWDVAHLQAYAPESEKFSQSNGTQTLVCVRVTWRTGRAPGLGWELSSLTHSLVTLRLLAQEPETHRGEHPEPEGDSFPACILQWCCSLRRRWVTREPHSPQQRSPFSSLWPLEPYFVITMYRILGDSWENVFLTFLSGFYSAADSDYDCECVCVSVFWKPRCKFS